MLTDRHASSRLRAKLARVTSLSAGDHAVLANLPFRLKTIERRAFFQHEGQLAKDCAFVVDGFACRHKVTNKGARQIVAFHLSGDFLNLQNLFATSSDHNVQALTRMQIAEIPIGAFRRVILTNPSIAKAIWTEVLTDAAIGQEWIMNIGCRTARSRLAHLLCELHARSSAYVSDESIGPLFPLTQEQLGDALGLTPVHISRVLKQLTQEGLIQRFNRQVLIKQIAKLRYVAEFNSAYLNALGGLAM